MNQTSSDRKEELFQIILKQWHKEFEQVKNIFDYLNTYPEFKSAFDIDDIHTRHSIDEAYKEWIWLYSKFDNKIESEFFCPYWIPISKSNYDIFIDISDDDFPLIETSFFFYEPYMWSKKILYKSMQNLLIDIENPKQLKKTKENKIEEQLEMLRQFMKHREQLAFSGRIDVEPVKISELFNEEEGFRKTLIEIKEDKLIINNVSSLICCVLPYAQPIKVLFLTFKFGETYDNISEIKSIRDFVFILRDHGIFRVATYKLWINKEFQMEYNFNHLVIHSRNEKYRDIAIRRYNSIYTN